MSHRPKVFRSYGLRTPFISASIVLALLGGAVAAPNNAVSNSLISAAVAQDVDPVVNFTSPTEVPRQNTTFSIVNRGQAVPVGYTVNAEPLPAGWTEGYFRDREDLRLTVAADTKVASIQHFDIVVRRADGTEVSRTPIDVTVGGTPIYRLPYAIYAGQATVVPRLGVEIDPEAQISFPAQPAGSTPDFLLPGLPAGWTATYDPATQAVTVTPSDDAYAGETADISVEIRSKEGRLVTTSTLTVTVRVKTEYTAPDPVQPGESVTIPNTGEGVLNPEGPTLTPSFEGIPESWNPTYNPETGEVTVTPPADATPGTTTGTVILTNDEGNQVSRGPITVTVAGTPAYTKDEPIPAGTATTIPNTGSPVTAGSTATFDGIPASWNPTLNSDGSISVTPPAGTPVGTVEDFTVTITDPSNTASKPIPVTVTVTGDPAYAPANPIPAGSATTVPNSGTPIAPEATGDVNGIPSTWNPVYNSDGSISVIPPAGTPAGTVVTGEVVITSADGTPLATKPISFTVSGTPAYTQDEPIPAGSATTIPNTGTPIADDAVVTFEGIPAEWNPVYNSDGSISVTPPAGTPAGTVEDFTVVVTASDGTKLPAVPVSVTVKGSPNFETTETVKPGEPIEIPNTGDPIAPGTVVKVTDLPEGWTGTYDPETGKVTITPPADAPVGQVVTPKIVVTTPSGDPISESPVTLTVAGDPEFVKDAPIPAGSATEVPNSGDPISPDAVVTFEGIPESWNPVYNPETGTVTVTPPAETPAGTVVDGKVVVSTPDGTKVTDTPIKLVVDGDPEFVKNEPIPAGEKTSVPNSGDPIAPGSVVTIEGIPSTWNPTYDPTTGEISVTPPAGTPVGTVVEGKVVVTTPDGTPISESPVKFTVDGDPAYVKDAPIPAGEATTVPNTGTPIAPEAVVTFEGIPAEWNPIYNSDGSISVTPPAGTPAGTVEDFTVVVSTPDGTRLSETPVKLVVFGSPVYIKNEPIPAGSATTVPNTGTPIAPGSVVTIEGIPESWNPVYDPTTGEISVTPPADTPAGTVVEGKVVVTTADGTPIFETPVKFTVAGDPEFVKESPIPAGEKTSVPNTGTPIAPGSVVTIEGIPESWNPVYDPTTGSISVTPPADTPAGTVVEGKVVVTTTDGTPISETPVKFTVAGDPEFVKDSPIPAGETTSVPNTGTPIAPGSVVTIEGIPESWNPVYDPETGTVSVTPPADTPAGTIVNGKVVVTTAAGDPVTETPIKFVIDGAPAFTSDKPIPAGEASTVPNVGTPIAPDAVVTIEDIPAGWVVSYNPADGTLQVNPPAGTPVGTVGNFTVVVTDADGNELPKIPVSVVVGGTPDFSYDKPVTPNEAATIPNTGDPIAPGSVVTIEGIPSSWNPVYDPETGSISVTPPADTPAGTIVEGKVVVTTTDGVPVSESPVKLVVEGAPKYEADQPVAPGEPATIPNTGSPISPDAIVTVTGLPEGWTATVDPGTKAVTVTPPADAKGGAIGDFTITVTDRDGNVISTSNGSITVASNIGFDDKDGVTPGETVKLPNTGNEIDPNATVEISNVPAGWTIEFINNELVVTVNPDAKDGETATPTITVTAGGKVVGTTTVTITASNPDKADQPTWSGSYTTDGSELTVPRRGGDIKPGTTPEIQVSDPSWTVTVDEQGNLVVNPDANAKNGDSITVTITAIDVDGNEVTETITITVSGKNDTVIVPPVIDDNNDDDDQSGSSAGDVWPWLLGGAAIIGGAALIAGLAGAGSTGGAAAAGSSASAGLAAAPDRDRDEAAPAPAGDAVRVPAAARGQQLAATGAEAGYALWAMLVMIMGSLMALFGRRREQ